MNLLPSDYELVDVSTLELHPENARRGNLDRLEESIRTNGFYGALVVQKATRHIVVGNHRYQAAVNVGIEQIPVLWVDVDDQQARKLLLVDNRSNDVASYDDDLLIDLLRLTQAEGGLEGSGYNDIDLEDLERLLTPPNLDDLIKNIGAHDDDSVFNPTISIKVEPETNARWQRVFATVEGKDDDERINTLLDYADPLINE
jgi:hypothetical protein